jgi:hypothetical protein
VTYNSYVVDQIYDYFYKTNCHSNKPKHVPLTIVKKVCVWRDREKKGPVKKKKRKEEEKKGTRMVSRANKFVHACIDRLVVRIRSRSGAPVPKKEREKSGVHVEQHECRAATFKTTHSGE